MQRTATLELRSLRKVGSRWEFEVQRDERLEKLLVGMCIPYRVKTTYIANQPGAKRYEINDEGMWLLSHLFANWTEMEAKATGKHQRTGPTSCTRCGKAETVQVGRVCICGKWFCEDCYHIHIKEAHETKKRACVKCEMDVDLIDCPKCGRTYCTGSWGCYDVHECVTQRKRVCTFCGMGGNLIDCIDCGETYCPHHYGEHVERTRQKQHEREQGKREQREAFRSAYSDFVFGDFSFDSFSSDGWNDGWKGFGTQRMYGRARDPRTSSVLPLREQQVFRLLGLDGNTATADHIKTAFRTKVKAASDGKGSYSGDMDALTRAKETALAWVTKKEARRG